MPFFLGTKTLIVVAGAISLLSLFLVILSKRKNILLDAPNRANSMHAIPVPRVGWIGVLLGVVVVTLISKPALPASLFISAIALCLISAVDDARGLPVWVRLSAHLVAAAVAAQLLISTFGLSAKEASGHKILLHPLSIIALTLAITWMTNLYNFMDGANGLAGLMGVIGFGALSYAIPEANPTSTSMALFCTAISASCLGFLFFNLPVARVFMGDAGSIPLGFLVGVIGLYGVLSQWWEWWFPVVVFSAFIVDASVTLAKRIFQRKRIWEAHREHYYHRLIVALGWSHMQTAMAYGIVMLSSAIFALSLRNDTFPHSLLWVWVLKYALLLSYLEWRFYNKSVTQKEEQ
jgi:UDP-N-acetylmuramyl pentapeptide phosphotransferase/UDP-N-acetylglucosamine-1-phosphate transferase